MRALESDVSLIRGEVFNVGSDSDNHTLAEMAALVAEQVPGGGGRSCTMQPTSRRTTGCPLRRSATGSGSPPQRSLGEGIAEIRDAVLDGDIEDYLDARYSNHKTLVAGTAALLRH